MSEVFYFHDVIDDGINKSYMHETRQEQYSSSYNFETE